MISKFVKIAKASEVAEGQMKSIKVGNDEILIAHVGGQYYAVDNVCTHQGGWLDQGDILADTLEIRCPLHEGCFDLRTGAATCEPCTEPLAVYGVRVEGDDILVGPPAQP